jgi:hypothetical protein
MWILEYLLKRLFMVFQRVPLLVVAVLYLCLCSLVVHEFAGAGEHIYVCDDPGRLTEHHGDPFHTHGHESEEDFITPMRVDAHASVVAIHGVTTAHLLNFSHAPDPLLPPPKAF